MYVEGHREMAVGVDDLGAVVMARRAASRGVPDPFGRGASDRVCLAGNRREVLRQLWGAFGLFEEWERCSGTSGKRASKAFDGVLRSAFQAAVVCSSGRPRLQGEARVKPFVEAGRSLTWCASRRLATRPRAVGRAPFQAGYAACFWWDTCLAGFAKFCFIFKEIDT